MKRHMRLFVASCVVALSFPLFADSVVKVRDPEDKVVEVPLLTSTKITFGESGLSIANEGADALVLAWPNVNSISFGEVSGVKVLKPENSLGLRRNPVYSSLEVTGHDGNVTDLHVISMSGAIMVNVAGWNGEDVDVSAIPAGVYILSINNNNIKFIKK